jgi:hypothetical protein
MANLAGGKLYCAPWLIFLRHGILARIGGRNDSARPRNQESPVAKVTAKRRPRTFYARLQVTRIEEWCVEAHSAEEAQQLLAAGRGERCMSGDCIHIDIENVSD